MDRIEERLNELGVSLPDLPPPLANCVPRNVWAIWSTRLDRSPRRLAESSRASSAPNGRRGGTRGYEGVRHQLPGCDSQCDWPLDRVRQVVAVHGLINCTPDFTGQATAMNGASDFVVEVFGEAASTRVWR